MAVGDRMPEVAAQVADSFAGAPFAGCFTFGEQGQIAGRNAHGNLMVAAIAFGRRRTGSFDFALRASLAFE